MKLICEVDSLVSQRHDGHLIPNLSGREKELGGSVSHRLGGKRLGPKVGLRECGIRSECTDFPTRKCGPIRQATAQSVIVPRGGCIDVILALLDFTESVKKGMDVLHCYPCRVMSDGIVSGLAQRESVALL